ncbi:hypothetical protein SERLA73DRAFT_162851 [Serpula lacrymans var. lacrymans S7.3]|uniref:Nephrocystin 3-like N-terminal domain-containing protein n=1 Tax=Serpula lacrymans var. lacrymans (strain S7.3) TaxID=936435 RepID=F8QAI1_SERL3|nr:hypothetical protein SERLA73DRAFT_162851 [Serpula lacrymans var. lacrymans S7.3]
MPFTQTGSYAEANIDNYQDIGRDQLNANITINQSGASDEVILARLNPVDYNRHYVQPCMDGTRQDIFDRIDIWLADPSAKNILWIKGSPGAGKSAIASSLNSQLSNKGILGGFFSFRRGDASLSNPAALWRTIAHELAQFDLRIASTIIETLKSGRLNPQRPNIKDHFNSLIVESLNANYGEDQQHHTYPVIVVDALDECDDSSGESQREALLDTLTQWSKLSKAFKLIITSRDDRIPSDFREACEDIVLPTGNQVTSTATADIRRAAGLFIWAETAMRFLEKGDPLKRLEIIRSGGPLDIEHSVNHLYKQITTNAWDSIGDIDEVVQALLGAIVFAKVPLSLKYLEEYFAARGEVDSIAIAIDRVLGELTSVISVGQDGMVRIEHLSFMEFLLDSDWCPDAFRIHRNTESARNLDLLRGCMQIMQNPKDGLRFNICGIETSYLRNSDIKDREKRIKDNIPDHLSYSSRYWGEHLADARASLAGCAWLAEMLQRFFKHKLLHWLEVMSLLYNAPSAHAVLIAASPSLKGVRSVGFSPDGKKVVSGSRDKTVRIWDATSGQLVADPLEGHTSDVTSVGFSPDGTKVVSGSLDCTVRIWDAISAQLMSVFSQGRNHWVTSIAISPNATERASGSESHTMETHTTWRGELVELYGGHSQATSVFPPAVPLDWERHTGLPNFSGWISYEMANMHPLLMHWIPPDLRPYWCRPEALVVIGRRDSVHVSYEHFVYGSNWTACQTASKALVPIVVYNGRGYDSVVVKVLGSSSETGVVVEPESSSQAVDAVETSGHTAEPYSERDSNNHTRSIVTEDPYGQSIHNNPPAGQLLSLPRASALLVPLSTVLIEEAHPQESASTSARETLSATPPQVETPSKPRKKSRWLGLLPKKIQNKLGK